MYSRYFYLAGPISGQTIAGATEWRDELVREWQRGFYCPHVLPLNPMRGVSPIPGSKTWGLAKWPATVEYSRMRDFSDIDRSDVVVFGGLDDAKKVSIGSMIEWGYATAKGKKIMVLRGRGEQSFHHHPWLQYPDFKAYTIDEAVRILHFYFVDAPFYMEHPGANHIRNNPDPSMGVDQGEPFSSGDRAMDRRVAYLGARRPHTDVRPEQEQARSKPPFPVAHSEGASGCWPPEVRVSDAEDQPGESGEETHSDYEDPFHNRQRG